MPLRTHQKFNNDAIHYEDDRFLIQTDGVFLGISTRESNSLAKYIISSYIIKGESFVKDLRGSFLVYLFDKQADKHLVYTNHVGDKRIYYYHNQEFNVISNSIATIISRLQEGGISYNLDHDATYYMLTYGFMYGDRTLISEVKRLKPGHYIKLYQQQFETIPYHKLQNKPDDQPTEKEFIEHLDELFRKAITLEFEKDVEYGFIPLCSLSGGLDSRMTTWVGHEMGYTNMVNFTFSRSGALDLTIPEQIAKTLNHKWIHKTLDEASFMCSIDQIVQSTGGITSFLPLSHGKFAIDEIDFSELGLLHTGQLGDVTLGSYQNTDNYGVPEFSKAASTHLIHKLPVEDLKSYANQEIQFYLNRGFNFILSGNLPVQQHTETTSPFLDIDFLDFCMSIPLKFRMNHRLYKKWILQKYPGAAAYAWEKLGRRITAKTLLIRGKEVAYSNLPTFILQGIKYHTGGSEREQMTENRGMNPFQYWYNSNQAVHHCIEQYFTENIDLISEESIRIDCKDLFSRGNIFEKAQVLTLLASVKLYWH